MERECCPTVEGMGHSLWCAYQTAGPVQDFFMMDIAARLIAQAHNEFKPRGWYIEARKWLDAYVREAQKE